MPELTQLEREELPLVSSVQDWLVQKYGPIQSFAKVPSPHEHRAYYPVAFVRFEDGRELVAKWHVSKDEKLQKEYRVSQLLLEHSIPSTEPIDFEASIPVLTMRRLEGQVLTDQGVTIEDVRDIGTTLAQIHAIPFAEALERGIPQWNGTTFAEEVRLKFAERFEMAHAHLPMYLSPKVVESAYKRLLTRITWQGKRGLNRRDAHPENWFRLADGRLAAIDHGNASVGDISYDLAHIVTEFKQKPEYVAAFRQAYGAELFDQAAAPEIQALSNLSHGLGMIWWIYNRGVPQPRYEAEAHAFIHAAIEEAGRV